MKLIAVDIKTRLSYFEQKGFNDTSALERIYKNFSKDNPKTFKFKVEGGRGVSKKTEKQLKKMLLKTL